MHCRFGYSVKQILSNSACACEDFQSELAAAVTRQLQVECRLGGILFQKEHCRLAEQLMRIELLRLVCKIFEISEEISSEVCSCQILQGHFHCLNRVTGTNEPNSPTVCSVNCSRIKLLDRFEPRRGEANGPVQGLLSQFSHEHNLAPTIWDSQVRPDTLKQQPEWTCQQVDYEYSVSFLQLQLAPGLPELRYV